MPTEPLPHYIAMTERLVLLHDHTTLLHESGRKGLYILIHALSMDNNFWMNGVFEAIASSQRQDGSARRVIAYDLRGHGEAADAPLTTSAEQLADDLRQLCAIERFEKVDVMGISYGGAVAQYFALRNPELVRSAVFMGTTSKGVSAFEERAAIAETKGMAALYEPSISRWFLPESISVNAACVQYARERLTSTRTENWAAAWRVLSKVDCKDRLSEIQVPVLCLAGRQDSSTPPELLKRIAAHCPKGIFREIKRGMHFFPLESPGATAQELIAFLDVVDLGPI